MSRDETYMMLAMMEAEKAAAAGDVPVGALIVKDGIIVGVMMKNHLGYERPCLAERCICTHSASDNNGAGYKTRSDYTYLLCVPEGFAPAEE